MASSRILLYLSFFAVSYASQNRTSKIQWGPCNTTEVVSPLPIDCSDVLVPLDYTDTSSNATIKLQLARVSAKIQPSKGSILLNFGGPGEPGRSSIGVEAQLLLELSGGQYDLIAFDPRGTGNTLPFKCYDDDAEFRTILNQIPYGNSSDVAFGTMWAAAEIVANACVGKANTTGSLIGTSFVARDLISIVDALGEDGMLRYWGFSYGTTLGATVAAMFPERIDKMIIDGVQNPHEYYFGTVDFQEWTDSDKVFSGIFSTCVAAGDRCALAYRNKTATAANLEEATWNLIQQIKYRPIAMGSYLLDYGVITGLIQFSLYDTALWPLLATILDLLFTDDSTGVPEAVATFNILSSSVYSIYQALFGIHCGDRKPRVSSFDAFLPEIDRLYNTSKIMADADASLSTICTRWEMDAKGRYEGDFQVQTKNPVLIIGNTYDGHTPLISAYNVSSGFAGSVVLEVNGYGHSSLVLPSVCSLEVTSNYWVNGTLPNPGTVCKVDAIPYFNITWNDIFQEIDSSNTSLVRGSHRKFNARKLSARQFIL